MSATLVRQLAAFACRAAAGQLSGAAKNQLKMRVLDALGCAIGALNGEPIRVLRAHLEEFDRAGHCTLERVTEKLSASPPRSRARGWTAKSLPGSRAWSQSLESEPGVAGPLGSPFTAGRGARI